MDIHPDSRFTKDIDSFKTHFDVSVVVDETMSPKIQFTLIRDKSVVYSYKVNSTDIINYKSGIGATNVSRMFYEMRGHVRELQLKDIGI